MFSLTKSPLLIERPCKVYNTSFSSCLFMIWFYISRIFFSRGVNFACFLLWFSSFSSPTLFFFNISYRKIDLPSRIDPFLRERRILIIENSRRNYYKKLINSQPLFRLTQKFFFNRILWFPTYTPHFLLEYSQSFWERVYHPLNIGKRSEMIILILFHHLVYLGEIGWCAAAAQFWGVLGNERYWFILRFCQVTIQIGDNSLFIQGLCISLSLF